MKRLAKATAIFVPMAVPTCSVNLVIVFSVELERIFSEYEAEYLFKIGGRDGRTVVVVFVVCFAYYCDALILRDVCIQACYIH